MAKVDIVIVSYNSHRELKKLLPTLKANTDESLYTLTIVDNNSRQITKNYLKTLYCAVVYNDKNLGYAAAANIGARRMNSPFILFLNPDCKLTPNWLEGLLKAFDDPPVVAAGPVLYDDKSNKYIEEPGSIPLSLRVNGHLNWVSGAVFCVRRAAWGDIGEFDERFFFMWEETEWCQRAVNKGFKVTRSYGSVVIHAGGKSVNLASKFWTNHYHKGRRLFYQIHKDPNVTKVLVAIPAYEDVKSIFFINFINTMAGLIKRQYTEGKFEFVFGCLYGHFIYDARNRAVEMALGAGCDYIWFIDSDMVVEPQIFDQLFSHQKPVVSTLCFRRGAPYDPMLFKLVKKSARGYTYDTMREWPKGDLIEVDAIGGGSFLAKTSIFDKMTTPYFFVRPGMGEDIWFSQKLMHLKIPMYVDTAAEVGHIGDLVIGTETFENYKLAQAQHNQEILGQNKEG